MLNRLKALFRRGKQPTIAADELQRFVGRSFIVVVYANYSASYRFVRTSDPQVRFEGDGSVETYIIRKAAHSFGGDYVFRLERKTGQRKTTLRLPARRVAALLHRRRTCYFAPFTKTDIRFD